MSLSDLASLGSFVSGVAVLASLVFLFFQMQQMIEQVKQAERNQQALITQGARAISAEIELKRLEPSVADALTKGLSGTDDISPTQYQQFLGFVIAIFGLWVETFSQHKRGLITDSDFADTFRFNKHLLGAPGVRQWWLIASEGGAFPDDFVGFVGKLMAEIPVGPVSTFDRWKAGVAALKANAMRL